MQDLVFIRRNQWQAVVDVPGFDQLISKLPTCLDQKSPTAHGRIADFETEELIRCWLIAQPFENGFEGGADDRLGQQAWRVMRPALAALVRGLKDHRASGYDIR